MKPEERKNIAKALIDLQEDLRNVPKDSNNPYFKSSYTSYEKLWDHVRRPLADAQLSVHYAVNINPEREDYLKIILMHSSGEYLESNVPLYLKEKSMQQLGGAITYGKRYGLAAILGIGFCDDPQDDDGNACSFDDQSMDKLIWKYIGALTDNFKDKNSLGDVYQYMDVLSKKEIEDAPTKRKKAWIEALARQVGTKKR